MLRNMVGGMPPMGGELTSNIFFREMSLYNSLSASESQGSTSSKLETGNTRNKRQKMFAVSSLPRVDVQQENDVKRVNSRAVLLNGQRSQRTPMEYEMGYEGWRIGKERGEGTGGRGQPIGCATGAAYVELFTVATSLG